MRFGRLSLRHEGVLGIGRQVVSLFRKFAVLITAGPGAQYRMQVSNMFTINFIFCPPKANSCRFKSISFNRNEPNSNNNNFINMSQKECS